jgi:hypothetical protein
VEEADYTPPIVAGVAPLSAVNIAKLRMFSEQQRNKEIADMRSNRPKLYAVMKSHISSASWSLIKQHIDFAGNEASRDPHILWKIIQLTHLTQRSGGNAAMRIIDRSTTANAFAALRQQQNEAISTFKDKFDEWLLVMDAAGIPAMPDEIQSVEFLEKLDPRRFGVMNAELKNGVRNGHPYPDTLQAAWDIASNWLTASPFTGNKGEYQSVFFADELCLVTSAKNEEQSDSKSRKRKKKTVIPCHWNKGSC